MGTTPHIRGDTVGGECNTVHTSGGTVGLWEGGVIFNLIGPFVISCCTKQNKKFIFYSEKVDLL
jgi:hypothetical protein